MSANVNAPANVWTGSADPSVLFGISLPIRSIKTATPVAGRTPVANPHYKFDQRIIDLLIWMYKGSEATRNLMLTGPTGTGKSSLIENFCARIGMPLLRVGCHRYLEVPELVGSWRLARVAGSSIPEQTWFDGPLTLAMRNGWTLLLDEFNFLNPGVVGAMNGVLDGAPLFIPETGEMVVPHPAFRIVVTGNSVGYGDDAASYSGIQKMNLALLSRFMVMQAIYLSPLDEAQVLNASVPNVPSWFINMALVDSPKGRVGVVHSVRRQFEAGQIEMVISTRELIRWGEVLMSRAASLNTAVQGNKLDEVLGIVTTAANRAFLDRCDPATKHAVHAMIAATVDLSASGI